MPTALNTPKFRAMPIYVYETTGKKKRRFELKQCMSDDPLTHDPESGEPVRRVITGGYGIMQKGKKRSAPAPRPAGGHCCGGGGCGCGH